MSENGKLIAALLGGAVAGVAIGLMLAPDKGDESRKKFADAANEFTDKVMQKAEELMNVNVKRNAEGNSKGSSNV